MLRQNCVAKIPTNLQQSQSENDTDYCSQIKDPIWLLNETLLEGSIGPNYIIIIDIDPIRHRFLHTFTQVHFLVVVSEIKSKFLEPFHFVISTSITNHFASLKKVNYDEMQ